MLSHAPGCPEGQRYNRMHHYGSKGVVANLSGGARGVDCTVHHEEFHFSSGHNKKGQKCKKGRGTKVNTINIE